MRRPWGPRHRRLPRRGARDSVLPTVREELQRLLLLQRVDDELEDLQSQAAAIPARREAAAQRRQECATRVQEAEEALEAAELERRRLEGELRDREAQKERLERQQFEVKSNEAYTTILREIDAAAEAISDAETGLLEALEAIDACQTALAEARASKTRVRGELEAEEKGLAERERFLEAELARVGAARDEAAQAVGRELGERYRRIGLKRRPVVVVPEREVCPGCRVGIPPQHYIQQQQGEELISCHTCQRILVHPRFAETTGGAPAGEGGSASHGP